MLSRYVVLFCRSTVSFPMSLPASFHYVVPLRRSTASFHHVVPPRRSTTSFPRVVPVSFPCVVPPLYRVISLKSRN